MITDYLIVGSGIAGLSLALKLSEFGKVVIITKNSEKKNQRNHDQTIILFDIKTQLNQNKGKFQQ